MHNPQFRKLIKRVNWYPPCLGMGIRVASVSDDFARLEAQLRQTWYSRDLFGTHFGGCLYAVCDPFYVFILTMNLGRGYIVRDRSASIRLLKPASGTITGLFEVRPVRFDEIRREVDEVSKNRYHFEADLVNAAGDAVARVSQEVHVRAKEPR